MKPSPTDTVPAMLTPGEAVLNREAAELLGRGTIKKLNHAGVQMRQVPGYADGVTTVPVTQLAQANQQNIANARVEWQKTIDAKRARDAAGTTTMTPVTSPQSTAASRLGGMKGYSASGPATSGGIYGDSTIGTPAASGTYLQQKGLVSATTPALEPVMNKPMSAPLGMSRQPAQQVDLMDQFKSGLGDEEIQGFANGGFVQDNMNNAGYLKYAAEADRNMRPIPTPQQYATQQSAGKNIVSAPAQKFPEESIAGSYGGLGIRPVQQPRPQQNMSVGEALNTKYGINLPAAQSALTDRVNYLGGEAQKYGEAFMDRSREVGGQGATAVADAGNRILAGAQDGGTRGLMRSLAREGANALVSAGQAILPNAADVQEFGGLARPVYSALTERSPAQQPGVSPQVAQQPVPHAILPAGAENTVRSPNAAPTPQYMQLDQPREPIAQPAAQPGWGRQVDINDVQSGEGVMRNATGTYGYRQMPNGDLIKFDAQGNQVGKLGNVGSRQQAGGMRMTSYGAMTPVDNPLAYETERRMAERTAAAEEAKLARLEELAMTGGGGDGTFEGMGNQKRIRRGAQAALGERMGMQRAQIADASQRATQQMQNETTIRGQNKQAQQAADKIDADTQLAALEHTAASERADETNKITRDMNLGTLRAKQRELIIKENAQNIKNRALKSAIDYYVASGMSRPESERRAYLEVNRGSLKLEE